MIHRQQQSSSSSLMLLPGRVPLLQLLILILMIVDTSHCYSFPKSSSSSSSSSKSLPSSLPPPATTKSSSDYVDRRKAISTVIGTACTSILTSLPNANANAATETTTTTTTTTTFTKPTKIPPTQIIPNTIRNTNRKKYKPTSTSIPISIPRIGYSLYKTNPDQVQRGINIALSNNVRHFDVASSYGSNDIVGTTLYNYCLYGVPELDTKGFVVVNDNGNGSNDNNDKEIVNDKQKQKEQKLSKSKSFQKRREELFITHKISNNEQSTNIQNVKNTILNELTNVLKLSYLDMVMIHSPLTDMGRRINTYKALIELKDEGIVKSIGVCHYGCSALDEIVNHGLPPPDMIQLQLSPFNQHKDVINWSKSKSTTSATGTNTNTNDNPLISCAAWSKLSGLDGPIDGVGWSILSKIASNKKMTKAQVLIQWSLQNNYNCVPRSGVNSKLERLAIYENSYFGMTGDGNGNGNGNDNSNDNGNDSKWYDYYLNEDEMNILNGLDENLKAGRLGVKDGYNAEDIVDVNWDPTDLIVS